MRESKLGEGIDMGEREEKRKKREKEGGGGEKLGGYYIRGMMGSSVPSAVIEDKEIVYRDYVDISLAVATPKVCVCSCASVSVYLPVCLSACLSICLSV